MDHFKLSRDIVSLVKPDGTVYEEIKAIVQSTTIIIHDVKLPLDEGDIIYRKLPNGMVEAYIVLDRGFHSGIGGIPSRFVSKVKRKESIKEEKYRSIVNVYNASGNNSRININSTDNSVNKNIAHNILFDEIKKAIESIEEKDVKENSLQVLEELMNTQNTPSFLSNYQKFIETLSNHMSLIAPFIPALTKLFQ